MNSEATKETIEISREEQQKQLNDQKIFKERRRNHLKELKSDNEYFKELLTWYQLQMAIPKIESDYFNMMKETKKQIEQKKENKEKSIEKESDTKIIPIKKEEAK